MKKNVHFDALALITHNAPSSVNPSIRFDESGILIRGMQIISTSRIKDVITIQNGNNLSCIV